MSSNDRIKALAETICYLKGAKWLDSQFGRNNWTPKEREFYSDYYLGDYWSEDELADLIFINGLDYQTTLEWLDTNRDRWENL